MITLPLAGVSRQLQHAVVVKDAIRALCSAATAGRSPWVYPRQSLDRPVRGESLTLFWENVQLSACIGIQPLENAPKRVIAVHKKQA